MRRRIVTLVALLGIASLPLFGGSMISVLGGANALDVRGTAALVDRPANRDESAHEWNHYGGDPGGRRYSGASEIDPGNVSSLRIAWEFSTNDLTRRSAAMNRAATEGTPILVADQLVFCTPFNEVISLEPGTGEPLWRFDPEIALDQRPANQFVCRGVAHWQDPDKSREDCSDRIFVGTNDARLIALDAANGRRCPDFGTNGEVRIDPGMDLWWPGEFQITSPPVVVGNSVVVGSAISDNARVRAPAGSVRAFDVVTGSPLWDFDPIPREPDSPGRSSWHSAETPREGHANVWAPMSADHARGLVFLPTSSPSPDFFGGLRPGDNRHANSIVALNAASGELVWSFQTVHHDVWDYDLPAQPGLYSVWDDGEYHDVVAQVTKTGLLFVLDRDTGNPFLPVEERPVPQGGAAGELLSPTQPMPTETPPIVPNQVDASDAFGLTWFDKRACAKQLAALDAEGLFTPPSTRGTLIYPFTGGGANWGGAAFDPHRNLLVVNMSNMAHNVQLIPTDKVEEAREVFHDQEVSPQEGAPFGMKRTPVLSPIGLPCTPPPWGVIAGIDLANGKIVWRKTLGTTEDLSPGPAMKWGTPNFGGPIVTATGLVFIGAAMDNYLRAFDVSTGAELWRGRLPAGGQATPMTYEWQGRQYVVIYAGGNARAGTTLGDRLVAFALP